MKINLSPKSLDDYETFLKVMKLPQKRFIGRTAIIPNEYANLIGFKTKLRTLHYDPIPGLFDYQAAIARWCIRKKKAAALVECGLGKTLILLEFARYVRECLDAGQCILIVSPLMVISQTMAEARKFYGDDLHIRQVNAQNLGSWLEEGKGTIGITNYEALHDGIQPGRLGCLILDEAAMLKASGKWSNTCLRLGRGLEWKLCLTGTPAPNDRIEYANHAVFLDQFPTANSFLAKFFINRGQTDNRWELKPHSVGSFYRTLAHWAIFVTNPATYGWKDNAGTIPPINVHIETVPLTAEQTKLVPWKGFFGFEIGGISKRSKLAQIAKGHYKGRQIATNKPQYIHDRIDTWRKKESTIIWCEFNEEQKKIAEMFPGAANITGVTPYEERREMIEAFQAREITEIITKGKMLGFGLNLQVATRQVFSALTDSYEKYHQCVKRSNRVGSTEDLNVHIPILDIERPMVETVLKKAERVQRDTEEQEKLFLENSQDYLLL
jgi:superfamily II DNA or RNA helicase